MKKTLVIAVAFVAALFVTAPNLQAQATVINHADGLTCSLNNFFGGSYSGDATTVFTPSGNRNTQCNATLSSGSPPAKTEVIKDFNGGGLGLCDITITKSGHAKFTCHI